MSDVGDLLLTGLLNHGNVLLGGALFFAALGVPLPATMLLMAAGAFTRQGELGIEGAVASALVGVVVGDGCIYLIGRFSSALLPKRMQSSTGWHRAESLIARWGGWSVFFSRFLLTPIAMPISLLAGSTRYPWARYMTAVLAGEVTWVALFGGLGHFFADHWEDISQLASDFVGVLLGALLFIAGLAAIIIRGRQNVQ